MFKSSEILRVTRIYSCDLHSNTKLRSYVHDYYPDRAKDDHTDKKHLSAKLPLVCHINLIWQNPWEY